MACLPTAGIIGSIVSGLSGGISTVRGLFGGGKKESKKSKKISNRNTYLNSGNKNSTRVGSISVVSNTYHSKSHTKKSKSSVIEQIDPRLIESIVEGRSSNDSTSNSSPKSND